MIQPLRLVAQLVRLVRSGALDRDENPRGLEMIAGPVNEYFLSEQLFRRSAIPALREQFMASRNIDGTWDLYRKEEFPMRPRAVIPARWGGYVVYDRRGPFLNRVAEGVSLREVFSRIEASANEPKPVRWQNGRGQPLTGGSVYAVMGVAEDGTAFHSQKDPACPAEVNWKTAKGLMNLD